VAKLKMLGARLGTAPPKLKRQPKTAELFYQSAAWHRAKAMKRAEGPAYCAVCGSGHRLILDHKVERKDGGADLDLSNLQWLCRPHHQAKTARAKADRLSGPLR